MKTRFVLAALIAIGSVSGEETSSPLPAAVAADVAVAQNEPCLAAPAARMEDLKFLLHKMFLSDNCEPLLNMMASEAIAQGQEIGKAIEANELIQKFRESFNEEKILSKFADPYTPFSDKELHALKEIHEMPVYEKFSKEGGNIFQQNFSAMKGTFNDLVASYGKPIAANTQVIEGTDENFDKNVTQSNLPVILEVYAPWCGACKSMEPTFRDLSVEYKDSARFVKVNYDESPEIVQKYNVTQLPTFLFIQPGQKKPAMKSIGGSSKADFEAQINQFLQKK